MSSTYTGAPALEAASELRSQAASPRSLLGWIDDPASERGVRFARDHNTWESWSWAEVAAAANAAAAQISELAGGRCGAVAIIAPNSPEFIAAFYGTLLAGLTPCPLAPPKMIDDLERYREYVRGLLEIADPVALVSVGEYGETLSAIPRSCPLLNLHAQRDAPAFEPAAAAELALLQFTSGSSGHPRAVRVTRENLEANLRAIQEIVGIDPHADEVVTWLPTYHDMGLIGCTLTPAATQVSMSMLRVEDFVMRPLRWLECLGGPDQHATMTGTPPFGLGYAMKRVSDAELDGFDFSRWRLAFLGAERIDAGLVARFIERMRDRGLSPSVFGPAYGLAEGTLVVSAKRGAGVAHAIRPDWSTVAFGKPVRVEGQATLDDRDAIGDGTGWLVGCGTCPPGVGVLAADEHGAPLPEGVVGELHVSGACVAGGYLDDPRATAERFGDEQQLRTGDAGFLLDGQLYVIGRIANALKVHGRWLFVEDVEASVFASGAVERSRCVVFAGAQPSGDEIVVLAEREPGDWAQKIAELLCLEIPDPIGVRVLSAARGSIARTSSGKPRRALLWAQHLAGELDAQTVFVRPPRQEPVTAPSPAATR